MDNRLCQQNVPKLTFLLKIHTAVMERHTPVTREESDIKLSYREKQSLEKVRYFDHPVTKIITPLEQNSS